MSKQLVLSKEWVKRFNLKRFLREHNRVLALIGAAIAFGTFVIKDGLRENLKDLVGSLENARSVFAIRNDMTAANQALGTVQANVHWIQYYMFHKPDSAAQSIVQPGEIEFDRPDFVTDSHMLTSALTLTNNIRDLLAKLPQQKAPLGKLRQLDDEGAKANLTFAFLIGSKVVKATVGLLVPRYEAWVPRTRISNSFTTRYPRSPMTQRSS
jgi:hypothetical protein